jgi:5-methylcytosine-specific restriction protein A
MCLMQKLWEGFKVLRNGFVSAAVNLSPFLWEDSTPFLEVHRLRRLADGGSDTNTNATTDCTN